MAKFYVQSGTFRCVVAAESTRKAALWAVHQVMQQVLPTDSEAVKSSGCSSEDGLLDQSASSGEPNPVAVLDGRVRVNERGFDRDDAAELATMEVVAEWNQMVLTLDRLQQMLHRA